MEEILCVGGANDGRRLTLGEPLTHLELFKDEPESTTEIYLRGRFANTKVMIYFHSTLTFESALDLLVAEYKGANDAE